MPELLEPMLQLTGLRGQAVTTGRQRAAIQLREQIALADPLPFGARHGHDLLGGGRRDLEAMTLDRAHGRHAAVAGATRSQRCDTAGEPEAERSQSRSPWECRPTL